MVYCIGRNLYDLLKYAKPKTKKHFVCSHEMLFSKFLCR